jgi:hypothetical protein
MTSDERAALRALAEASLFAGEAYENAPMSSTGDDLMRLQAAASDADGALVGAAASIVEALDALGAAEAERAHDEQRVADLMADVQRIGAERDAAIARAESAEADARRYRWLRDGTVGVLVDWPEAGAVYGLRCRRLTTLGVPSASPEHHEIDAAIDAHLAAKGE